MALATGSFGLPAASPTIQPFGPFSSNTFNNQPSFFNPNLQQNNRLESLMKQMENENPESLWSMIQQNSEKLQNPFGSDGQEQGLPWQQNRGQGQQQGQSNSGLPWQQDKGQGQQQDQNGGLPWQQGQGQQQGQSNGDKTEGGEEKKNWLEELFEQQKKQAEEKDEAQKEAEEEWREQFEEMQEEYEEYLQEKNEQRETTIKDIQLFSLLLLPFKLFDYPTARYFAAAELLSTVLTKLGVNDDDNLLFLLFVQCVDIIALSRGRFKLVDGYQQNWYQEIFDYMMTKMNYNDMLRLGAQMLMPQSPAPDYEVR